jgi:hypothetical protein
MLMSLRIRRAFLVLFGALTMFAATQSGIAAAQAIADPNLSADQARALFVSAGYQVDELQRWDWLAPAVTTFQVHDVSQNRVLLVQVYPDVAQAQRGSQQPVEGYSVSTWIDNLAMFEANADEYQRIMTAALARSLGMSQADVIVPTTPLTHVDKEYTSLVSGVLAEPTSISASDSPTLIRTLDQ